MSRSGVKIAVLMGGISSEREVSLSSGAQVAQALVGLGFDVRPVDVTDDLPALVAALSDPRPDVVFNALHGRFGEDGAIQGVLEWLNIPYTHSGVLASSMAMDKAAARAIFIQAGLPVALGRLVTPEALEAADPLPRPYVIKPLNEGSSVGVDIVFEGDNRREQIARAWRYGPQGLVEEFIPGRELTVAVLGDRALCVTEITAAHQFYDYESKYQTGGSAHTLPAPIAPEAAEQACAIALAAHRALGLSGASRTDFRYDDTKSDPGRLVILETNAQPGMTPTSLLPEQAAYCGMGFAELCLWLVEQARCRV